MHLVVHQHTRAWKVHYEDWRGEFSEQLIFINGFLYPVTLTTAQSWAFITDIISLKNWHIKIWKQKHGDVCKLTMRDTHDPLHPYQNYQDWISDIPKFIMLWVWAYFKNSDTLEELEQRTVFLLKKTCQPFACLGQCWVTLF